MFCPECGKKLSDDSVFCEYCGARADDNDEAASEKPVNAEATHAEVTGRSGNA